MTPPAPAQEEGAPNEACHHMARTLERIAEGTAGPLARTAAHLHVLSCGACRDRLSALRAAQKEE